MFLFFTIFLLTVIQYITAHILPQPPPLPFFDGIPDIEVVQYAAKIKEKPVKNAEKKKDAPDTMDRQRLLSGIYALRSSFSSCRI